MLPRHFHVATFEEAGILKDTYVFVANTSYNIIK